MKTWFSDFAHQAAVRIAPVIIAILVLSWMLLSLVLLLNVGVLPAPWKVQYLTDAPLIYLSFNVIPIIVIGLLRFHYRNLRTQDTK